MPRYSCFTRYGLLAYSSKPSEGEKVYRALKAAFTDPETGTEIFDMSVGTHFEATLYARAMAIAAARATVQRVANQDDPWKAYDALRSLMSQYGVKLPRDATMLERRTDLAARMAPNRGARYESVVSELQRVLGSDFVAYRPIKTTEAVSWPTSPGDGPGVFARSAVPAKVVRLLDAIATDGAFGSPQTVAYENWHSSQEEVVLSVGDVLCVEPEIMGLAEKAVVTASTGTGSSRKVTALFAKPHNVNCSATTGRMPIWWSTKRHVLIVVKAAAAIDRAKRSRVAELMRRVGRAPTQWSIVQPTTPGATTVGPYTLGTSPLGVVPIGTITI